jgi:riboflavin synthase
MFTGIIEAAGVVTGIERTEAHARLSVALPDEVVEDVTIGDSIAINGVCLTVVDRKDKTVAFDAVFETMRKTALGHLAEGDTVNIERPMPANGRFDGHIVQGHVDATGSIASIRQIDNSFMIYIDVPRDLMRYIVPKGSVAVDGISLTVVDAADRTFSVSIIPHTWEVTNLNAKRAGDPVNIETDVIGKYVERLVGNTTYAAAPIGLGAGKHLDLPERSDHPKDLL